MPTREIARAQAIPEAFAHQVLGSLVKAGLVRTLRGPGGGHTLTGPPEAVTLLDVVESVEGRSAPDPEARADAVSDAWDALEEVQRTYLRSVSLATLARAARERTMAAAYAI